MVSRAAVACQADVDLGAQNISFWWLALTSESIQRRFRRAFDGLWHPSKASGGEMTARSARKAVAVSVGRSFSSGQWLVNSKGMSGFSTGTPSAAYALPSCGLTRRHRAGRI